MTYWDRYTRLPTSEQNPEKVRPGRFSSTDFPMHMAGLILYTGIRWLQSWSCMAWNKRVFAAEIQKTIETQTVKGRVSGCRANTNLIEWRDHPKVKPPPPLQMETTYCLLETFSWYIL